MYESICQLFSIIININAKINIRLGKHRILSFHYYLLQLFKRELRLRFFQNDSVPIDDHFDQN